MTTTPASGDEALTRTLKVEFRLDDGYQPVSFSQEFEMHGAWNPHQVVELMNQRWRELRAEYMEMFIDEPGGKESLWQKGREVGR